MVEFKIWKEEFKKRSAKHLKDVVFCEYNSVDFGDVSDQMQLDVFIDLGGEDIQEWEYYDDSCYARADFRMDLESDYEDFLEKRRIENNEF